MNGESAHPSHETVVIDKQTLLARCRTCRLVLYGAGLLAPLTEAGAAPCPGSPPGDPEAAPDADTAGAADEEPLSAADEELLMVLAYIDDMPTWHQAQVIAVKEYLRNGLMVRSHRRLWT